MRSARCLRFRRRAGTASALAALAIGAIVGLAACGSGDGGTSGRASTRPSIDRPSPEQPDRTTDTETAEPDRRKTEAALGRPEGEQAPLEGEVVSERRQ